jgi:type IV pilus assembly protein PilB
MAATAHARLTGLPRRLVRDGVINESIAAEAEAEAQKSANSSIVSYLVEKNLADPRDIASAACHEFGVPVLDLDAIEIDLDTARLVDEKLMRRHRVLPLFRRGRRVYVGVSDPTRLQAIDEIKFATGMSIEAIVVEDNKLDAVLMRLTEALDTTFQGLGGDDLDLENLDISEDRDDAGRTSAATRSTTRPSCVSSTRSCWTRSTGAPRTSTSSPTRSSTASAPASTACSRRSPARPWRSPTRSPRASR